ALIRVRRVAVDAEADSAAATRAFETHWHLNLLGTLLGARTACYARPLFRSSIRRGHGTRRYHFSGPYFPRTSRQFSPLWPDYHRYSSEFTRHCPARQAAKVRVW